jgi:hypothetical protein
MKVLTNRHWAAIEDKVAALRLRILIAEDQVTTLRAHFRQTRPPVRVDLNREGIDCVMGTPITDHEPIEEKGGTETAETVNPIDRRF